MIGVNKCIIAFDNNSAYMVMLNPVIVKNQRRMMRRTAACLWPERGKQSAFKPSKPNGSMRGGFRASCAAASENGALRREAGAFAVSSACMHCMACICSCPVDAIEYGKKSVGQPRYHFEAL